MHQPARFELRPMGVGDILDTAFRLYRAYFVPFFTISLLVYVPYILIMLVLQVALGGEAEMVDTPLGPRAMPPAGAMIVAALSGILLLLIVLPLVQSAMMMNISAAYLGEPMGAGASYRRAAARLGALLGTQFLVGLVVMLGFLLLIVPGIIFSLWFIVIAPVVILESVGGTQAMSRSKALMSGNLNKGFTVVFVVGALSVVLQLTAGFALGMLHLTHPVIQNVVTNVLAAVLLPFQTAATILLYYDLRIRKEAFDLQRLASTMPMAPAPA